MDKRKVTIFGAGVAGLTAAHELVIRGFEVTVYDPEINHDLGDRTLDRGIGGMARSQFVYDDEQHALEDARFQELRPVSEILRDATIELEVTDGKVLLKEARPSSTPDDLRKLVGKLKERSLLTKLRIYLPYQPDEERLLKEDPRFKWLLGELDVTEAELDDLVVYIELETPRPNMIFFGTRFRVFPAEHGFRFFPSFYRHLFDTMKRTPIKSPRDYEVGLRTAFENLVPVDNLGFARGGDAVSFLIPRRPPQSFEEFLSNLRKVLGELEWSSADLDRFGLKLFQYMTSCTKRRVEEYENMSWSEFVGLESFSPIMREHIEFGPQMMASLRGSHSDARTQGTVVVQLLLDHLRTGTRPDATLGGPTSSAWFRHWHDYLRDQNVQFFRGKCTGFKNVAGVPVPLVDDRRPINDGYVVFALPILEMAKLVDRLREVMGDLPAGDLTRIVDFLGPVRVVGKDPPKESPLRHMSGIQYFFDTEVRFWRGHTQYLDSEWGLTSIAQQQFWRNERNPTHSYRSVLSVDVGIWDRDSKPVAADPGSRRERRPIKKGEPTTASTCNQVRLADEVWAQIEEHHDEAFAAAYGKDTRFPYPRAFALDQGLTFDSGGLCGNQFPFLVNTVGQYQRRPGELAEQSPKTESRYRLQFGRFVLAGTFMKTFTRITSMESANESARHAVNAILKDAGAATDRCEIWDPEDNEMPELEYLKELDARLYANKMPHFSKILGLTELPMSLHPDLMRDVLGNEGRRR